MTLLYNGLILGIAVGLLLLVSSAVLFYLGKEADDYGRCQNDAWDHKYPEKFAKLDECKKYKNDETQAKVVFYYDQSVYAYLIGTLVTTLFAFASWIIRWRTANLRQSYSAIYYVGLGIGGISTSILALFAVGWMIFIQTL